LVKLASHPAKFSAAVIDQLSSLVRPNTTVLDPFAGTGRIHDIGQRSGAFTVGVEIEPEWASMSDRTIVGDATRLPFRSGVFDMIVTSPVYGNRLSDHHKARDGSVRHSYTHDLGRTLHPNNAGSLQWGEAYRALHDLAWAESKRVLRSGGIFILNISDHVRGGKLQPVTDWHITTLAALGFDLSERYEIPTPRLRYGANAAARVPYETVAVLHLTS